MKTDVIIVSSRGERMEQALREVDKVCAYKGLTAKQSLHLRLLTEETMSMMRSITGETEGQFWIEDEDGTYELHLKVNTRLNTEKREQLLKTSRSGKNESARGLMGKLRDFFDRNADDDALALPGLMHYMDDGMLGHSMEYEWSMIDYVSNLKTQVAKDDQEALKAWDELEKSVVSHVADDIKVNIKGREVEMIIVKKLA